MNNIFKLNTKKGLLKLIRPFIWLILLCIIWVYRLNKEGSLSTIEHIVFVLLLVLFVLIPILLFINHWKNSKDIEVEIADGQMSFSYKGCMYSMYIKDISKIEEIGTYGHSLPWSDIRYWRILVEGQQLVISSLILPKSKVDFYFWNKKITQFESLPLIKGFS